MSAVADVASCISTHDAYTNAAVVVNAAVAAVIAVAAVDRPICCCIMNELLHLLLIFNKREVVSL